jgi:hypothetical protein
LWQSIGIKNSDHEVEALWCGLICHHHIFLPCGGFALVNTIKKRNPKTKRADCLFSGTFSICTNGQSKHCFVLTAGFWLPEELRAKMGSHIESRSGSHVHVTRQATQNQVTAHLEPLYLYRGAL